MSKILLLFFSFCFCFCIRLISQTGSLNHYSEQSVFEKYSPYIESNENRLFVMSKKNKHLPAIGLGAGILTYQGDLSNTLFTKIKPGFNISIEQHFTNFLGIAMNGTYGKLSVGKVNNSYFNFESPVLQGDLSLFLCLKKKVVSPYFSIGYGYMAFDPYGDLKDEAGNTYYYWKNGAIKNISQSSPDSSSAIELIRDYKYETKLTDSVTSYTRSTATMPLTLGVNVNILEHFSLRVGATYNMLFSDWIDNYKNGSSNDNYLYTNITLQYRFGKTSSDDDTLGSTIERINLDDKDGDGIKDFDDQCPGTPKGLQVDKFGCLIDTDKDGIADYKDKEPNSLFGANVDQYGVTITAEMIAKREEDKKQLLAGKLETYKESNKVQSSSNGLQSSIPSHLNMFDKDNDGKISTGEIASGIDAFFDGDSNVSISKLNELIDYFFEQ
jgi:hypothetical protein